jgi:hypothetical protein
MTPRFAIHNSRNRRLVLDAELVAYLLELRSFGASLAHRSHDVVGQFGVVPLLAVLKAFWVLVRPVTITGWMSFWLLEVQSPLVARVVAVVLRGAGEKVVRAHAGAIVAGVARFLAISKWPIVQLERETMREHALALSAGLGDEQPAIPVAGGRSCPLPAAVGRAISVNLVPEPSRDVLHARQAVAGWRAELLAAPEWVEKLTTLLARYLDRHSFLRHLFASLSEVGDIIPQYGPTVGVA